MLSLSDLVCRKVRRPCFKALWSDQSRYSLEPEISEEELMRMEEATPTPAVLPMGRVAGYSFEPEFSEEEYRRMEEDSPAILPERRPNQGGLANGRERPDRRLSLTWCSCQLCSIMPIVKECLCCKEMNILKPLIGEVDIVLCNA